MFNSFNKEEELLFYYNLEGRGVKMPNPSNYLWYLTNIYLWINANVTGFGGPYNLSTGTGGEMSVDTIPDEGKYLIPLKPG